jgi:hypothetical protein
LRAICASIHKYRTVVFLSVLFQIIIAFNSTTEKLKQKRKNGISHLLVSEEATSIIASVISTYNMLSHIFVLAISFG